MHLFMSESIYLYLHVHKCAYANYVYVFTCLPEDVLGCMYIYREIEKGQNEERDMHETKLHMWTAHV